MEIKDKITDETAITSDGVLLTVRSCSNCKNYQPDTYHLWCRTSDYSVTPIEILADEIKIKTDCNEKRWSPC